MSHRFRRLLVIGLLVVLTSVVSGAPAAAQPTVLLMHSQPGDYIGAGGNWLHTPADGAFSASRNFDNGVTISFQNFPATWWYLDFAAPGEVPLVPGTYEMATRFPFQEPTAPGLSVGGTGRGCNTLTGRFTIFEVVYGAGDAITSFAANFEQHCEGQAPALYGSIRYNAAPRAPFTVSVATGGSGSGTVTSFPAGIACGATCSTPVSDGLISALIATPAPGSSFAGWSGPADCNDGVVSDATTVACTATFVTCSYAVSPSTLAGSANGGFGQIDVTATPGCSWTPISSGPDWLFVDSTPRSGSQPVTFNYFSRGPLSTPRSATISVGSAVFTLTQPGTTPDWFVSPTSAQVQPGAGIVKIGVVATVNDVPWTAMSNDAWLGVPAGGAGSAVLDVTVGANPLQSARTGTVVVAGVVVTVQQLPNGPPGVPASFTAAVDDGVGRFTWGAVPGGNADSYRLEAGFGPGDAAVAIPLAATPVDVRVPGVPPGRYFVRLRGVNQFGIGPTTEDVELVVGANGQSLPAAPQSLFASMFNGTLQAQWRPAEVPGDVATGFVLEAGTASGRTDVALPMGLAQFTTIGNVPPGAYVLRVRAVNGAGAGPPSPEQLVVAGAGVSAVPGTPGTLQAQVTGSTVTLQWSSSSLGGMPDRFRLEVGSYRGATAFSFDTPLAQTTIGFTAVPPGRYFVRVRGVNAQGPGPATADIRVDVP